MAGNLLGPRSWYLYTADNGSTYSYYTDDDLATAVGATLDDSNDALPRSLKPRILYCEDSAGNRKSVIAPATTTTAYANPQGATITIDGTVFAVKGTRGERRRAISNT